MSASLLEAEVPVRVGSLYDRPLEVAIVGDFSDLSFPHQVALSDLAQIAEIDIKFDCANAHFYFLEKPPSSDRSALADHLDSVIFIDIADKTGVRKHNGFATPIDVFLEAVRLKRLSHVGITADTQITFTSPRPESGDPVDRSFIANRIIKECLPHLVNSLYMDGDPFFSGFMNL